MTTTPREEIISLPRSRLRVRVLRAGAGRPVVLMHGLGGIAEEVMAPLRLLDDAYELIALDRPGYGGSDPLPAMDAQHQAAWLAEVLDHLDLRSVVLLAHSIAAAPALWFADEYPRRLRALVLVCPFCRPTRPALMPALRIAVAPFVGPMVRAVLPKVAELLAPHRLAQAFAPDPVPAYALGLPFERMAQPSAVLAMADELNSFNTAMMRLAFRLRGLRVRTAVIAGARDSVAPWARHGQWLSRRLPRRLVVRLPQAGHMAHHVSPAMIAIALEGVASPVRHGAM